MWNQPQHSYEEVREVVVDILLKKEQIRYEPNQFGHLENGVAEVFARRSAKRADDSRQELLHPYDAELVRDVFWDLFRQGYITLGINSPNPMWPFFRLSHFGQRTLAANAPYRFHDSTSFLSMVKKEVPDISDAAFEYLDEAVSAFYAGCLLASCVMLGVAAEAEFLGLLEVAQGNTRFGPQFAAVAKVPFIRQKITNFQKALNTIRPTLPREVTEDLEINLDMIQSVLRIARNDAGHPTTSKPTREQVYVFLQLFTPFARQLMKLRGALTH